MQLSRIVQWYLRMSIIYLFLGTTLGALFGLKWAGLFVHWSVTYNWVLVHVHLTLVGFVSMMIFGISYHTVPRFAGRGVHPYSTKAAVLQFWLVNVGLWTFSSGLISGLTVLVGIGGLFMVLGMYIYAVNLWLTISPSRSLLPIRRKK